MYLCFYNTLVIIKQHLSLESILNFLARLGDTEAHMFKVYLRQQKCSEALPLSGFEANLELRIVVNTRILRTSLSCKWNYLMSAFIQVLSLVILPNLSVCLCSYQGDERKWRESARKRPGLRFYSSTEFHYRTVLGHKGNFAHFNSNMSRYSLSALR